MNDRGQEGNFRLINGSAYDVTDLSQPALYKWLTPEPNNAVHDDGMDEDCVQIYPMSDVIGLNDNNCHKENEGNFPYYGLCEILSFKCIPTK